MKQKIIVLTILILIATSSSFVILSGDSYFNRGTSNKEVVAVEQSIVGQVASASESTTTKKTITKKSKITKKSTTKKKSTKKKTAKKKKKSKVNLAPPVITTDTAPHSAKNKYN